MFRVVFDTGSDGSSWGSSEEGFFGLFGIWVFSLFVFRSLGLLFVLRLEIVDFGGGGFWGFDREVLVFDSLFFSF